MAYDVGGDHFTFEAGTTALEQFRFVRISSTRENAVVLPSAGGIAIGATIDDYDSTSIGLAMSVQVGGIVKVEAPGSTLAFGDAVAASSEGKAVPSSAGDFTIGHVVKGTSGTTGRILSVLMAPVIGTT